MKANFREGFWLAGRHRRTLGLFCVVLGLVAGGFFVGKIWTEDSLREVIVDLEVINDKELVAVNCQQAGSLSAQEGKTKREVDLGWLEPDDLITYAVLNEVGEDFIVSFDSTSNGRAFGVPNEGSLGVALQGPEGRIVFVRTFTADGQEVGPVGCALPRRVDDALPYSRLAASEDDSGEFSPRRGPDLLISIATILGWALAVLGVVLLVPLFVLEVHRHARGLIPFLGVLGGAIALIVLVPVSSAEDKVLVLGIACFGLATVRHLSWSAPSPPSDGTRPASG
jgi:hypothetical protein